MQVLFQNAQTTAEAKRPESLCDHRGTDMSILLKELGDGGLEGIQLARALTGAAVCAGATSELRFCAK